MKKFFIEIVKKAMKKTMKKAFLTLLATSLLANTVFALVAYKAVLSKLKARENKLSVK